MEIVEQSGLFAAVVPGLISPYLAETLAENVMLAVAINTEKARSEFIRHYTDLMIFVGAGLVPAHNRGKHKALPLQNVNDFLIGINSIIAPILGEIRKLFKHQISLFSGIEFNVDKDKDLTGFCDFIISHSPEQLFLKSPLVTIVEAKNENIMSGLGQCMAEMIAARIYNEREGLTVMKIYGVVTSGNLWKFIKLENNVMTIDLDDYGIKEIAQIVGILSAMIQGKV